jgi:hypothetical protein
MCLPLSAACSQNSECCSGNCISHGPLPGFCCVPGGCP